MMVMIDNYDSFTYNLVQYLEELGTAVSVFRNDQITVAEIEALQPAARIHLDGDDVDAPIARPVNGLDVGLGQGDEPRLLGSGDRFLGRTQDLASPGAHLDQDEAVPLLRHEVQLAGLAAPVAGHDLVAGSRQPAGGQLFAQRPQAAPGVSRMFQSALSHASSIPAFHQDDNSSCWGDLRYPLARK